MRTHTCTPIHTHAQYSPCPAHARTHAHPYTRTHEQYSTCRAHVHTHTCTHTRTHSTHAAQQTLDSRFDFVCFELYILSESGECVGDEAEVEPLPELEPLGYGAGVVPSVGPALILPVRHPSVRFDSSVRSDVSTVSVC